MPYTRCGYFLTLLLQVFPQMSFNHNRAPSLVQERNQRQRSSPAAAPPHPTRAPGFCCVPKAAPSAGEE